MERIEFCCHTKMSRLQGISEDREYINEAIERGYKQLAITDKNSTQAFYSAANYLKLSTIDDELKIIYGVEATFKENKDSEKKYSIYIYVKEQIGLRNLYKLVSKSYEHLDYGEPVIYRNELNELREGLLYASIGKKSEIYQNVEESNILEKLKYYDFVGIEPNKSREVINKKIYELCKNNNKILIGTSECIFINKEDYRCNEILNFYKKSNNIEKDNESYFQTTEELIAKFYYIENAKEIIIDNPKKIAEQIGNIKIINNYDNCPKIPFSDMIISKKCYDKAHEIYGEKLPKKIDERLKLELHSIIENNYQDIYFIYNELVEYSHNLGYEVGARGCVSCSLVAYLLEITRIDPIKYNLPFEIFAGKDYNREPDIDLNFSKKVQEKIFKYLQKKYGKDRVIWGGTIGTISDRTLSETADEYEKAFELDDFNNKKDVLQKLSGINITTGEHPGGIFILPENIDIYDICPTEPGNYGHLKTHNDYHSIWMYDLYKFDILAEEDFDFIKDLEIETNTNVKDIDLEDKETLEVFINANNNNYKINTVGIPGYLRDEVKEMLEIAKPSSFNDLVYVSALAHGTDTWNNNASLLIKDEGMKVNEVISNREDMMNYLIDKGIDKRIAFDIVDFVRVGKAARGRNLWKNLSDRYKINNNKWNEYKEIMLNNDIPEWYIKSAEKINYMFPKSHAIDSTINAFRICWYKVHYPEAYLKVYLKYEPKLDIKKYYCKKQVIRELNKLYDKKERHEIDESYEFNISDEFKIKDLELILEMYNRGVLKEKKEIIDDYNLINSRAISDYCRKIGHKFNTEELAVLIHRNNKMKIEDKIKKYNDLIDNYPDMEVIERINCKHYDSVKTLIKMEIQRLEELNKKFKNEKDDSIYVWTEYNKSTLKFEHVSDVEHTFKTFNEAYRDIKEYINEYDDTISFRITKKFFDHKNNDIYADYAVDNKKIKMIDITGSNDDFIDINQIFINIPTPFEKGDILISNSKCPMRNYGDYGNIFVLEDLCNWREDIDELLEKGNFDSSDMIAYGYYLYEDNTEFVRDHKWDYDSFEYYEGELNGNNRILKDISSFLKGKIGLELFVHAYDAYKAENARKFENWYTDEGLKLAGMNEKDIDKSKQ